MIGKIRRSDAEAYTRHLQHLSPTGRAWNNDCDSQQTALNAGMAEELARVDGRVVDFAIEATPSASVELLPDWESVVGLPDPCFGTLESEDGRRALVLAILAMQGGASPSYFEQLGALFDRPCTVDEEFPFVTGLSSAGDGLAAEVDNLESGDDAGSYLSDLAAPFHWWVKSEASWASRAHVGEDFSAGDFLLDFGDPLIECLIDRFKPAHTQVHHEYDATAAVAALED